MGYLLFQSVRVKIINFLLEIKYDQDLSMFFIIGKS